MGNVAACLISVSPAIAGVLVVFLVVFGCFNIRFSSNNRLDIPGPLQLPLIGCMYLFRWSNNPHKILACMSRIYGDVYCLKLGGTDIVVVNSMDTIRHVLYQNQAFYGRPHLFSFNSWGCKDSLMVRDYSSEYLQLKYKAKISLQKLLNNEDSVFFRFQKAIQKLNNSFEIQEIGPFDPDKHIRGAVADFVMENLFGSHTSRLFYHEAQIILEQASNAYVETAYPGACLDFISVMRFFSKKKLNATQLTIDELHKFVRKVYQVHLSSFLQQSDHEASLAFILRSENKGYRERFDSSQKCTPVLDEDGIVELLAEIMFNAYEKISTCFGWCIAKLAADERLQGEIRKELTNQFLQENTPLLTATINEVLRTSCVLPFGIPRKTTKDTTLHGYKIPKNTLTFLNFWSSCRDAQKFSNPHEFNPYRFMTVSNMDAKSTEMFPSFCCFSGGERKCLGDIFARRCLMALGGGVLREYDLELVKPQVSKLYGKYGFTQRPCSYTIIARRKEG